MKEIETERLILRPWRESDAESLYEYAKDKRVGPMAGWPVHKDLEDSLRVIREVLSQEGCLAVTIKGEDRAVGSIGIFQHSNTNYGAGTEIGYWIGVPFWGKGYIPEAVRAVMRHCFEERGDKTLWCGFYEGNDKSRRVIEKCGFTYTYSEMSDVSLMNETRREYLYSITLEDWEKLC